jgi:hypothetical protein
LYVGADGVFAPVRDAWKKDGRQGDLLCRYAECKVGVVFETAVDETGKDASVLWQDYVATFADAEAFAPLLGTLAHRQGHPAAKEVILLCDGAPWLPQVAARQFQGAVCMVDFFHACQHLATVAEARFGAQTEASQTGQKARQDELLANRLDGVLKEIAAWRPSNQKKREIRRSEYLYFYNNAERMRYQTYLNKGYQIGSGVVEAACKRVVAQRLDQTGMHWRPENAEAIVALRAALCSTHAPDLTPYCTWTN